MNQLSPSFALSAVALAASLLVTACGGGDAEPPPKAAAPATGGTTTTDITAPTVVVSDSVNGTAKGPVTFTFTFSEEVGISFTADDVTVTNGSKGTFQRPGTTQAILLVTPTDNAAGNIGLSIAAGAFKDLAGNANAAAVTVQKAFDTVIPPDPGNTGTCTAAPCIDFAAATVGLEPFEGLGSAAIVDDPANAANKVLKLVKVPAGQPWAGATVYTEAATKTIGAIGFATSKVITLRVYSPAAGKKIRLKVEDGADPTVSMEKDAVSTKAGAWETLSFDFTTPDNGSYNAAKTYNKLSLFPDFLVAATADSSYYFDELKVPAAPAGGGSGGATSTTITFDEAAAPVFTGFGGAEDSTLVADPSNAANKVAKVVKAANAELWAGTTVSNLANQAVAPIGFSASSKTITVRVWSPDAGIPVRLKVENAADNTKTAETEATTTVAGGWQTLSFNFANVAAGTAALDLAQTFNKVSIFFNFGQTGAQAGGAKTYYFDDIVYPAAGSTGGTGGTGGGGLVNLVGGVYASNYTEAPTPWKSVQGGTAGRYVDTGVVTQDWWSGLAANDATPSFYFGYGLNSITKPWGFGAYVSAPNDGVANVAPYTNLRLSVWGNDQLMNAKPTLTVILKGPTVAGCTSELKGSLTVAAPGVQTYTLPLAGFTLQTACAYASAAAALAGGVSQVHIQVLGANLQYTAGADANNNFPNGLNVGPIGFN